MYRLKIKRLLGVGITLIPRFDKRLILTQAYHCEEEWQKRLSSPLLKNLIMDQYFVDTDKKFNQKNAVSGVDIDLFANNVQDASQIEELEHLLFRFRRTKRSVEIMDSTIYSSVRTLLQFEDYETLFRLLKNPESYGIFPDHYTYNTLMDTFIEKKMYKEAVDVAILMMLQEDFSNEISCLLAIYSCQIFLKECSLDSLNPPKEVEEVVDDDDEEEEQLVRVPLIRNPFFDDHFHLTKPEHLIGKVLFLAGRQIGKDPLGATFQLYGLALYEKWDKILEIMNDLIDSKGDLFLLSEGVELIKAKAPSEEGIKEKINNVILNLEQGSKIKSGNLDDILNQRLKTISNLEEQDIREQKQHFLEWEQKRKLALEKQDLAADKKRRLEEIAKKKEYLFWKEKLLFFFENESKILDEYQKAQDMITDIKSKTDKKDAYVPPEIIKRATPKLTKYQRLAKVKKL